MNNAPQTFGKYQIIEEIGRGGSATVYRATDSKLDREVALKIISPERARDPAFLHRFQREGRAAARLRHSHIVTIYETGEFAGNHYIAMEYIPGPSLAERLQRDGPRPWEEAYTIITQVAAAVAYAHSQGMVHRDLKPANILLDPQHGAMLTDFGLVKQVDHTTYHLTSDSAVMGTMAYMPLEVWQDQSAGPPTDVYALGCILAEMLTGRPLFSGETPLNTLYQHQQGAQPPTHWPPGTPTGIKKVLQKALAKEAGSRYPDATAFLQALRRTGSPQQQTAADARAANRDDVRPFLINFNIGFRCAQE